MTRRPPAPTALLVLLVSLAAVPALAGCGAGRDPETYRERPTVDAALATVGELALRGVYVEPPPVGDATYPQGGTATARASIVNLGERPDRLVSVSTPAAATVELRDPTGKPVPAVPVGRLGVVTAGDFSMALQGLTAALRPGQSIELTFTFVNNGRRTLLVPVQVYPLPAPAPSTDVFAEPGGEGAVAGEG